MKKTLIMNSLMSALGINKMPEENEFLGAIKLITGEELLAKVTHVFDEDGDYIIVEDPIEVEEVTLGKKQGAKTVSYTHLRAHET